MTVVTGSACNLDGLYYFVLYMTYFGHTVIFIDNIEKLEYRIYLVAGSCLLLGMRVFHVQQFLNLNNHPSPHIILAKSVFFPSKHHVYSVTVDKWCTAELQKGA